MSGHVHHSCIPVQYDMTQRYPNVLTQCPNSGFPQTLWTLPKFLIEIDVPFAFVFMLLFMINYIILILPMYLVYVRKI
jgi:hypothetical protein